MTEKTQKQIIEESFELLAKHGYDTRQLIGNLSDLNTTEKGSLVAALNELLTKNTASESINLDNLPERVKNILSKGKAE